MTKLMAMIYLFLLIVELIVLSLLAKKVYRKLSLFFLKIVRRKKLAVWLMAVLYFPGTLVHELAHFFAALALAVPVGEVNLIPRIEDDRIKYGSVSIAKKGPIRMFLISIAPLIIGTLIIFIISYLFLIEELFSGIWAVVISGYLVFTTANSMFLSKSDLKGVWALLVSLVVISIIIYVLLYSLFNIDFGVLFSTEIIGFVKMVNLFLALPILINVLILLTFGIKR